VIFTVDSEILSTVGMAGLPSRSTHACHGRTGAWVAGAPHDTSQDGDLTGLSRGSPLRRLAAPFLFGVALFGVLLEATVWRWLGALGRRLAQMRLFAALERLVERLSPNAVVAIFVLPWVPIVPLLKLGEIWLIRHRHFVWAMVVIVGVKVVGAAFSTRLFAIARPKLMQVRWFARMHGWVVGQLALGHALLEAWPAWVRLRAQARRLREALRVAGQWLRARLFPPPRGRLRQRLAAAMRRLRGRRWL
jgi:hypothetical protein